MVALSRGPRRYGADPLGQAADAVGAAQRAHRRTDAARSARALAAPRRADGGVAGGGIRNVRAMRAPLRSAAARGAVLRDDGWTLGRARLGSPRRAQRRSRLMPVTVKVFTKHGG